MLGSLYRPDQRPIRAISLSCPACLLLILFPLQSMLCIKSPTISQQYIRSIMSFKHRHVAPKATVPVRFSFNSMKDKRL